MINLDKLDPDWKFATTHGQASFAGKPYSISIRQTTLFNDESQNKNLLCKCCYEHVYKTQVPLMENSKQLQFLGFGFPLFYQFLKNCMILLLLTIFSYNAISIKMAIDENHILCHNQQNFEGVNCQNFMVQISKIQITINTLQQAIRIISFVLHMAALLYFKNRITKLELYYDERTTSLSDYSILFIGFKKVQGIQKSLKQFLNKQFKSPHQIKQITLLPQYPTIQKLQQQKNKVINALRQYYDRQETQSTSEQMANKLTQLSKIEKDIYNQALATKQMALSDKLECQKIICVFNTQNEKDQILQQFDSISNQNKIKYFGQGSEGIYAIQAPEPQQIIWQNAYLTKKKRILYFLLGWGLSILLLIIVFIIYFFVLSQKAKVIEAAIKAKTQHPDDKQTNSKLRGAVTLVFILMFLVVIFNKIAMSSLFHKFTRLQKHQNNSRYQFSYEMKLTLGLFFTTAIMTLAVQAIRFNNFYKYPYGVIDQVTIMFLVNSFFVPIFWLIHPTRIFKLIKRKLNYGKRSLTQRQANKLMQQQNYDMGKRLAQVLQIMWFTFFYSTLIPIGAIVAVFGLFCYYWVDKYNLLRRSAVNGRISGTIIHSSLPLLDFTLLLRPLGSIIFDSELRSSYMPSNVAMIVVSVIYMLLPKDKLISCFNGQKFRPTQKTYLEAKQSFHKTYHTEHPVYRIIYLQKLHTNMLKRGHSFNQHQNQIIKTQQNLIQNNLPSKINDSNFIFISPKKTQGRIHLPPIQNRNSIALVQ